ncbi:MAG: C4-dicarboxylate ABC transporter permease [Flexibacter sp. CG_4_10_14_3_um_filter_32_15]|nr:MAG: C4-dicarboxylate ABC transporter permease [Flexibacter sp. CG_4_10_14_3_um_filter_32_15]
MIIKAIDKFIDKVGELTQWFASILVLLVCVDVILRYTIGFSSAFLSELEWHIFSFFFLVGAAYTLKDDKHVRVDVFYARFSEKRKALVNLFGTLLFLIPFCVVIIKGGVPYTEFAFRLSETSPDPGGLPARFVVKSFIVVGFGLLLLQGISLVLKSIFILIKKQAYK